MERILKWLDDLDDLNALLRVQAGPVIVTALLLVAFLAVVARGVRPRAARPARRALSAAVLRGRSAPQPTAGFRL